MNTRHDYKTVEAKLVRTFNMEVKKLTKLGYKKCSDLTVINLNDRLIYIQQFHRLVKCK